MATAAISGHGGTVGGTGQGSEVRSFQINVNVEPLDATSFASSGWREFVEGLAGAEGSYNGVGATVPTTGSKTSASFDTGHKTISGDVIIQSVEHVANHDGVVEYNASFVFTGSVSVS